MTSGPDVPFYWPQRLVHIPSFRSHLKRPGNVYDTLPPSVTPRYATLSYTWGRFEDSDGEAILISGVPWRIPAINKNHFTKQAFKQTLLAIAEVTNIEFVWIDVGCLNQDRRPALAPEAFRQRDIFSGASAGAIWLSRSSGGDLRGLAYQCGHFVQVLNKEPSPPWLYGHKQLSRLQPILRNLRRLFTIFLSDPWWGSLWTLQEAFANPNALLMSSEGRPVLLFQEPESLTVDTLPMDAINEPSQNRSPRETTEVSFDPGIGGKVSIRGSPKDVQYLRLKTLVEYSQLLWHFTAHLCEADPTPASEDVRTIRELLGSSALPRISTLNLNLIYHLSWQRFEARPGLRLEYLCQSVYNIPRAVVSKAFGLSSTSLTPDAFGRLLLLHQPVWSQLFVHSQPAPRGFSWRMDPGCTIPDLEPEFSCIDKFHRTCTFETRQGDREITFSGPICALSDLTSQWRCGGDTTQLRGLCIDNVDLPGAPPVHIDPLLCLPQATFKASPAFAARYWKTDFGLLDRATRAFADTTRQLDVRVLLLAGRHDFESRHHIGLLIVRTREDSSSPCWARCGLCFWTDRFADPVPWRPHPTEQGWSSFSGIFV